MKLSRKYYRPTRPVRPSKPIDRNMYIGAVLIFFIGVFTGMEASACDEVYLKVGAGYKVHSEILLRHKGVTYHLEDESHPVSFRGELGCEKGRLTMGVSKYSQWFQGWPVDNQDESNRVEIFVDYKFRVWGS